MSGEGCPADAQSEKAGFDHLRRLPKLVDSLNIDHRGLAYASDRVGTGLFILGYTGRKPTRTTSQ